MYLSQQNTDSVWSDENATSDAIADASIESRIEGTIDQLDQWLHQELATEPDRPAVIDITIVVPVYNEIETLPEVLARIDEVMPAQTEVIVVDDASTDGSTEWLKDHWMQNASSESVEICESTDGQTKSRQAHSRQVISRRANHGKGSAVRLAIRHSQGRVVAIQDADLEYDPADLLGVIWPILEDRSKVVYGSRYLRNDDKSLLHRLLNATLTSLSNLATGQKLTDMETCHKAFDGELVRSLSLRECRFGIEPEITAKVAARGIQIDEVPTKYRARSYAEGKKIGWRDGIAALACLWRYRG